MSAHPVATHASRCSARLAQKPATALNARLRRDASCHPAHRRAFCTGSGRIAPRDGPCTARSAKVVQSKTAGGLLAALTAVGAMMAPLDAAYAVSGGVSGSSIPLSGQDLSKQDFKNAKLAKATLRKTNFSQANLTGASLFGALAEGANFSGANMTNADLELGNFDEANFTDAVLAGAFVSNAQFKKAKIDNTDWTDVVLRKDMQTELCKLAKGTNPTTGVDTRESLLCR